MRYLELYAETPTLAVETADFMDVDPGCELCPLHDGVRTVCMGPAGKPGGLLVVADYPGIKEDMAGRPFIGKAAQLLRDILRKSWSGPIVVDFALKCAVKSRSVTAKHVNACRGYLAATVRDASPKRIIAMGSYAVQALLGRSVPVFSARRGYDWLGDTPVFIVMSPAAATRNPFVRQWLADDIEWACTVDPGTLMRRPLDGLVSIVESAADAEAATAELRAAKQIAYDTETAGRMFDDGSTCEPRFRVLCVALCASGSDDAWLWDQAALRNPDTFGPLEELLEDPSTRLVAHNEKFDHMALQHIGVDAAKLHLDTWIVRAIQDPEARGELKIAQNLVGMGGGKDEAARALTNASIKCKKADPEDWEDIGPVDLVEAVRREEHDHKTYTHGLIDDRILHRYCGKDAVSCARLGDLLEDRWREEPRLLRVWDSLVRGASYAVAKMEQWGVAVDTRSIRLFQGAVRARHAETEKRIMLRAKELGMPDFRLTNTDDLRELVYERLGMRAVEFTGKKNLPTTKAAVLERYASREPVIRDILDWKKVEKNKGTYADPLSRHVRSDGRIHPSLRLAGARTGRLSCLAHWVPVLTARGMVSVSDIRVGDMVWTHRGRPRRVWAHWLVGMRPTYRLRFENGCVLTCTGSHRLLSVSGRWVAVETLVDDRLGDIGSRSREHRVLVGEGDRPVAIESIEPGGTHAVYDMSVEEDESYMALGVFAHNCTQPNIQNVPRADSDLGKMARQCFVAPKGRTLVQADFCLSGDTLIDTPRGLKEIQHIEVGDLVYTYDFETRRPSCQLVSSKIRTGVKPTMVVVLDNGERVRCTPNHRWLLKTGEEVRASDLEVGDRLLALRRSYADPMKYETLYSHSSHVYSYTHKVAVIERDGLAVPTFDIEVAKDHNFALAAGVFVHNSQAEIRVAASLSNDPLMRQIFVDGDDYHMRTAKLIAKQAWNIEPGAVEKKHRSATKAVVFGLMYGKTAFSLARDLECSVEQAEAVVAAIMGKFKEFARFKRACLKEARQTGHIWSWWEGDRFRRRPLWRVKDADEKSRRGAENASINSPIQAGASDLTLDALVEIVDWIEGDGVPAKLVLTVHDSIMVEARDDVVDEVVQTLPEIMTQRDIGVPLEVDVEVGPTWGNLEAV